IYLVFYTISVNTPNPGGELDVAELLLYVFTVGFICEELTKFWKAGRHILGFWNAFNGVLYSLVTVSFILRPFSPATPGGVVPPLSGLFPSFGRTLTAEEQNNLERRKQEEQFA
ncbi:hypothetical protein BN1723_020307, partial [Verticillium longisporum]